VHGGTKGEIKTTAAAAAAAGGKRFGIVVGQDFFFL
jgi:hypothetical protein